MFALTSPIWFVGHALRFVQVRVVVDQPVAARLRVADAAGEVVALVDGDREERVLPRDPVLLEVGEERLEGVVVVVQLLVVRELARAHRRARRTSRVASIGTCRSCASEM